MITLEYKVLFAISISYFNVVMFVISEFLSNGKPKVLSSSVIVPSPVMSHILSENMYNACKRAISN